MVVLCASLASAAQTPKQPKLNRPEFVSKSSIQVSLKKVSGVNGYYIYVYEQNGMLKMVKVASGSDVNVNPKVQQSKALQHSHTSANVNPNRSKLLLG